jgi:predicted Fe-Mo cluster-binding NifX family protein
MKIAISSQGEDSAAMVDPRFGRTRGFAIHDTTSGELVWLSNAEQIDLAQGAGIQAALKVIEAAAKVVITGHCGPKAFRTLSAAGVDVVVGVSGTISEAIARYQNGDLQPTTEPNVDGHW